VGNVKIRGVEGMTAEQLREAVARGGKFVLFPYTISVVVMTFRRSSDIFFIPPGGTAGKAGLPYVLTSAFLGWWGFPWGLIYTPMSLFQSLKGGKDVTAEVMAQLAPAVAAPYAPTGPQNPWTLPPQPAG
jgi:hypothetical protein